MSELSRKMRLLSLGAVVSIGASACVGTAKSQSSEAKMLSEFNVLAEKTPVGHAMDANYTKTLTRTLPNGVQIRVIASSLGVEGTQADATLNPDQVDGIDIIVYPAGAHVGYDKPAFGLSLGQEVDGRWDAVYEQQYTSIQPYSIGESNQKVLKSESGPGALTLSTINPTEATAVYAQTVAAAESLFISFKAQTNLATSPNVTR